MAARARTAKVAKRRRLPRRPPPGPIEKANHLGKDDLMVAELIFSGLSGREIARKMRAFARETGQRAFDPSTYLAIKRGEGPRGERIMAVVREWRSEAYEEYRQLVMDTARRAVLTIRRQLGAKRASKRKGVALEVDHDARFKAAVEAHRYLERLRDFDAETAERELAGHGAAPPPQSAVSINLYADQLLAQAEGADSDWREDEASRTGGRFTRRFRALEAVDAESVHAGDPLTVAEEGDE